MRRTLRAGLQKFFGIKSKALLTDNRLHEAIEGCLDVCHLQTRNQFVQNGFFVCWFLQKLGNFSLLSVKSLSRQQVSFVPEQHDDLLASVESEMDFAECVDKALRGISGGIVDQKQSIELGIQLSAENVRFVAALVVVNYESQLLAFHRVLDVHPHHCTRRQSRTIWMC